MEVTLSLTPADAARLPRLPQIKSVRSGRSRSLAVRIVWHDSLDRTLASGGLALAEQRGTWSLDRQRPAPAMPWPPATDHRVILRADGLESLRRTLMAQSAPEADGFPEAITPVAAFEGRRTVFPLIIDAEPVTMTLLDGVLRAVAAERPTTRLVLEGSGAPVWGLLLALAETVPLTVPSQSLGAEALHLADGSGPPPRRSGAPALPADGLPVHEAFRHIVGHLTDVLLSLAPLAAEADTGPEPVHQMRVAVRRARSAFALFQPVSSRDAPDHAADGLRRAVDGLRRLGQILGPARDWDVFMTETAPPVEAVLSRQTALNALLRAGKRRRQAARLALGEFLTGPAFRLLSLELACIAAADPAGSGPEVPEPSDSEQAAPTLKAFAADVLQKRWKKLLDTGKTLDGLDDAALHGLRLKAKRLRYAAEFFAALFPEKSACRFIRRLAVLQECLGLFNDTTVAETLSRDLGRNPGYAAGLVLGFTAARGVRAKPKIAAAWARFRRRDPFWE